MANRLATRHHEGIAFIGNRVHPNEIAYINAQMAKGQPFDRWPSSDRGPVHEYLHEPRQATEHTSTVLERLHGKVDVILHLADLTVGSELPSGWHLRYRAETRQSRADKITKYVLSRLGRAAVLASDAKAA